MSNKLWTLATALVAMTVMPAATIAQATIPPLSADLVAGKPVNILPADPKSFEFKDSINTADKPGSFVYVSRIDGKPLYRAVNNKSAVNFYGVSAVWENAQPVMKGDVLLLRYSVRTLRARQESGESEGTFFVKDKKSAEPYIVVQGFSAGPEWTHMYARFVAPRDMPAGDIAGQMFFGQLDQSFEVAGPEILNFGNRVAVTDLPITKFTYAGREPDAAWRKAALARIEELRTAPLNVRVVDRNGRPVSGARVDAAMTRSAFVWGTAIDPTRLLEKSADADRYRAEIKGLFDVAYIENSIRWPLWMRPEKRAESLKALDWLLAEGKVVKGNPLAWTGWKWTPKVVSNDPKRCEKIASLQEAHIRDIVTATKGRITGWVALNEPVHETDYWKCVPRETAAQWFKLAHQLDPSLELTLNEYAMLNRSSSPLMIADMLEFSRMLKKNGARIDILGVQGHVGQTPRPPASVLSDLDLLAVDGDAIQITEFDINTRDEAIQADYTRDFLIAVYSHKALTGLNKWGFWEKQHWKPDAAMFAADWREKPNLKPWRELVMGAWRTRVSSTTGSDGSVSARGHLGRYAVTVHVKGRTQTATYDLTKGGTALVVRVN